MIRYFATFGCVKQLTSARVAEEEAPMRLYDIDKTRKATRAKQPFTLTSEEILADLLYPAPVRSPKQRRGRR